MKSDLVHVWVTWEQAMCLLTPSPNPMRTLLIEASRRLQTLAAYDSAVFDQQPQGTPSLKRFIHQIEEALK